MKVTYMKNYSAFCPFSAISLSVHPKTMQEWLSLSFGSLDIYRLYVRTGMYVSYRKKYLREIK